MQVGRAEVGLELPGVDPAPELGGAASAQLCPGAALREDSVEEDRELQLGAEHVGQDECLGGGRAPVLLCQVDDGRDVDRAHARVDALVRVDVGWRARLRERR